MGDSDLQGLEGPGAEHRLRSCGQEAEAGGSGELADTNGGRGGKVSNSPNFGQKALSNHPEIQGEPDREVRAKPVAGQPDPEKRSTFGKSQGLLNPAWVEQLMNFPVGWTDCEASATQSCQR